MATLEIQLQQYLGAVDNEVLAECAQLCRIYKLDPDTFNLKWESYAVNHGIESSITKKDVNALKELFHRQLERAKPSSSSSNLAASSISTPKRNPLQRVPYTKDDIQVLSSKLEAHRIETPSHNISFANRKDAGKIELQYNQHLETSLHLRNPTTSSTPSISLIEHQQTTSFKYMYDKLAVIGETMNDHLEQFEEYYLQSFPEIESFENPSYVTQSSVYSLGRIVMAVDTTKLVHDSIQMECSRKFNGVRVPLQLDVSLNLPLFPGQILVVYGHNPTGEAFLVERVLQLPFPEPPSSSVKELLELEYTQTQQPTLLLVASGPFTLSDNLLFEPFQGLLNLIRTRPPDVLILFGPFLDDRHTQLTLGQFDSTFSELFRHHFLNPLLSFAFPILLVPHFHDMIHEYLTFPQPPFSFNKVLPKHIYCVPNPTQLCINEVVFGLISKDVLLDMSKFIFQMQPTDRIQFVGSQLLVQRSLYPLFPPPENEGSIDYTKWSSFAFQVSPDILLWPSQLRFHVKPIGTSLFVNPGFACKGQSGGTVAWISVLPLSKDKLSSLDPSEHVTHQVAQRVFVEIVKL